MWWVYTTECVYPNRFRCSLHSKGRDVADLSPQGKTPSGTEPLSVQRFWLERDRVRARIAPCLCERRIFQHRADRLKDSSLSTTLKLSRATGKESLPFVFLPILRSSRSISFASLSVNGSSCPSKAACVACSRERRRIQGVASLKTAANPDA